MKPIVRSVFCVALLLVAASAVAQEQQFATIGDLTLDSGEVLKECRIGYRTSGTLNADRSNVILFPTWAGGTTEALSGNAAAVKAQVLVIVGKRDHTVTPGPAIEFAHLLHAELLELDDECGHQYGYCEDERVRQAVAGFLAR